MSYHTVSRSELKVQKVKTMKSPQQDQTNAGFTADINWFWKLVYMSLIEILKLRT